MQYLDAVSKQQMISVRCQCKPFNITVTQVYAPTTNAEAAKDHQFNENLHYLLELTPKKKKKSVLFIIENWNAKIGSQGIPRVTGKFDLGVQNETGQRLTEFCQENATVITNILSQQHNVLYPWTLPDGQYRLIIFFTD